MADEVKFTDEDLMQVRSVRVDFDRIYREYGELTFAKHQLEMELRRYENQLTELRVREEALVTDLNTKYGVGALDLQTGTFTPA